MNKFEFRNYTLDLNIAGVKFSVNCAAELMENLEAHQAELRLLADEMVAGEKTSFDAISCCKAILEDLLGETAFTRIFAGREATLTNISDVLRFVVGEITMFLQNETVSE